MVDAVSKPRVRMTGSQRREQLLDVGRELFAEKGFEATSIEEIASRAAVSKPVVYEHFGGKEGLYAVVVDREMRSLLDRITSALTGDNPRALVEQAALALLTYIEEETDGFQILVRDSPVATTTGTFSSLLNDIASQVEYILSREFQARRLNPKLAGMYAQMLVGMVALTGQWWLEVREPARDVVAAHLVNLGWNGLRGLQGAPTIDPLTLDAQAGEAQAVDAQAGDSQAGDAQAVDVHAARARAGDARARGVEPGDVPSPG